MDTITFSIARNPEIIQQAKHLCHDVYLQMGYISKAYPGRILPGQDIGAAHVAATNKLGEVVGTVRLSRHVPVNIFDAWKETLFASCSGLISNALGQNSFSIGQLAVNKAYAGMKISGGLYRVAYEWALARHMSYGIISMDYRAFRALKIMGWHVVQVGGAAWYLGSPTIPAIIPIREQQDSAALKGRCCPIPVNHQVPNGYVAAKPVRNLIPRRPV